jgi:diguanylate cyclase (GGDEF)-like protein
VLAAPIPPNESARLESLRRMLLSCAPTEASLDHVTQAARRIFGTPIALISVVDSDRLWFKSCIGLSVRETPRDISFCGHAILEDAPLVVEDALLDARFADNPLVTAEPKIRFYAGRPLRNGENFPLGALCIIDHEPRTLSQDDRRLLDDLGLWAEAIFASKQLSEAQRALQTELDEAKRETMVDPLLHIWNRWAIVDILEREAKRALRHRDPLSVLMVEVGHIASITDRHGQSTADAMLKEVTRVFNGVLRPYDTVGRCGGEEFLIVLPDTDSHAAAAIAKRLRQRIADCTVTADSDSEFVSCTACTGVASIERHAGPSSVDTLVASAADALMIAKGGNGAEDERDHEQLPNARAGRVDGAVLEGTDDDWLGNPIVAAQLARLRAHVVDD